ncbi:MAG: protein kinase [Clostridia bacterium]|nr:protein kinase [Clostridia bacterium]
MIKVMSINGYELTTEWKVVGGMSEVAFAKKGGKEWFIKKFISPKYPIAGSPGSERIKEQKRKNCIEFENRQKKLNDCIKSKCGLGGNLIYAVDFFRHETCYYKINEKIDVSSISIKEISRLNTKDILIILRSIVHSLRILHRENIVHGDLKPDNILIKMTGTGTYTAKLIDFDDSYFSECPPKDREQVVGTPEYYSPELFDYISDEDDDMSLAKNLTIKSDIFALGVIFTEYLTGEKPIIPSKYSGTYSAVKHGAVISFKSSSHMTIELKNLLLAMLDLNYKNRPSVDEIFDVLRGYKKEALDKVVDDIVVVKFESVNIRKSDNKVELEWCVENAREIRINGSLPLPKKGKKFFPYADEYILTIVSDRGEKKEEKCRPKKIVEPVVKPIVIEADGESKLRGDLYERTRKK